MVYEDYKKIASSIPRQPGVYRFIASDGEILYVGKAKNLKNRLASYFTAGRDQRRKTKLMVRSSQKIVFTIANTEHDALLLESTLIKKHQPKYNINLKDGKTYSYICIKKERFPRIFFTRRIIEDGSTYFGPYTSKYRTEFILDALKRIFPLRTCTYALSEENIEKGKFKVCLEYHIKNCNGPCEGLESEEKYKEKIAQIKNILRGNLKAVREYLQGEMSFYAERMEYEQAAEMKERIEAIKLYQAKSTVISTTIKDIDVFSIKSLDDKSYVNYLRVVNGIVISAYTMELTLHMDESEADLLAYVIPIIREKFDSEAQEIILPFEVTLSDTSIKITIPQRGDKKHLLDMSTKNVKFFVMDKRKKQLEKIPANMRILHTLQNDLSMNVLPIHIECFDNSNIQGTNPTSSCVVFKNAKPSKKDYRHFSIKSVEGPDDFASMEEVVYRRYHRLTTEKEELPQLIIIDGGKGQLSSAMKSIDALGLRDKITVIGIAKKLEEIYFPEDPIPLHINKKSESLRLIQQARDEAHRFALRLHRNQRSKKMIRTELITIPGVGVISEHRLLERFRSVARIKEQSLDSLKTAVSNSAARAVYRHFHGEEE